MSLNNPQDSVCDYLAELLYEGVTSPEADTKPVERKTEAPQAAPVLVNQPLVAPKIAAPAASAKRAQPVIEQDPSGLDKEKLNRLLNSAQLARESAPPPSLPVEPEVVAPLTETQVVQEADAVTEPAREPLPRDPLLQWCDNGRPQWAQERFDVLLFKVYGLTLAVPLIALGQIQPLDDQLTPLFGQADWFMGIQPTPMGKIKTVNTALFVMPERYNPAFLDTARYVISIHGVPWGLAVDSVEQPKSLSPDDVKWRSGRTQRPWLAGTVKEYMCALIDIPNMADLLNAADHNSRKPHTG